MTAPLPPSQSLRRAEAESRRALLDVTSYDVTLDLAASEETFRSVTEIRLTSQGGATFLDVKPVVLHRVLLDGESVPVDLLDRGRLPLSLAAGEHVVQVEATMRFRNDGEGLHRSVDPADGRHYVYGMSFMDAAPSVFACFDQPDLKAPYTFHVTAPADWHVEANAAGEQVAPGVWEFERSQPLSTYFVTLVAGPYHVVRDEHDGIPLTISARASLTAELQHDAAEIFAITKASFDEFHRLFGIRYPFGKYHQAFVPEFNAGAMENPGCVTFRDTLIFTSRVLRGLKIYRAAVIAHEMAHQWFGNIVTPRWWDDLWLNESFAEYMGNRVAGDVTEYADIHTDLTYSRRQWGLTADQAPSSHPVAGNGAVDSVAALQDFDGISYMKGSAILKQLNAALGDETFFAGVIDHLESHRFGNATMHDLIASWERAGAGDLSGFSAAWLRTKGPDAIMWDRAAGVIRKTPPADAAERSHTFRAAVHDADGWRTEPVTVSGAETPYAPAGADAVILDPYDDTWACLIPDGATVAALPRLLPGVTDDGLRAGIWSNLRSAFHNATVAPAEVIDIAVASLPVEDAEDGPRRTRAWLFGRVLPLAPEGSDVRLYAAAIARLVAAEPGSELQLSAFRAALALAPEADPLRSWLETAPEGIVIDAALRWRILARLAALGAIDRAELRASFEADPAKDAKMSLEQALCSLPDEEAKAYAWQIFTGVVDLPNYEVGAAGIGMWQHGQRDLTAGYVERYFAEVPGTVSVRSGWVLAEAAEAFFPRTSLTPETLAAADTLIALPDLDPPLRRAVSDCTDTLRRQLAVRRAFGI
jgi:aminopeptidase N